MSPAKVLSFPAKVPAVRRGRDERAFLPAALEIIDTPASPVGRSIALLIVAAVIGALVWACLGKVDIIATAPGRIVPVGRSKTVQPLEAGVVRAIRVADGDHVRRGQVLIDLDPTSALADRTRFAHDLIQAGLDRARLEGLRRSLDTGLPPALIDPPRAATGAELATAVTQMQAQAVAQAEKLADLDQQMTQKREEGAEAAATLAKERASLPYTAQVAGMRARLLQMGWGNRLDWLRDQQRLVEQRHDLAVTAREQQAAEAARQALEHQRDEARAEYEQGIMADLAKAQGQISESKEELIKAAHAVALQMLRAPIDGTVQQLAVHTVGGVVTPSEELLRVVPDNARLVIDARVANSDIGFVRAGQPAEIKVEAFPFTRYGLIHGTVTGVSRDAVGDDGAKAPPPAKPGDAAAKNGSLSPPADASPGYTARITLGRTTMTTEAGRVDLQPGMAVTAEIKTGRRRIISYLLSPFARYRHDALTER